VWVAHIAGDFVGQKTKQSRVIGTTRDCYLSTPRRTLREPGNRCNGAGVVHRAIRDRGFGHHDRPQDRTLKGYNANPRTSALGNKDVNWLRNSRDLNCLRAGPQWRSEQVQTSWQELLRLLVVVHGSALREGLLSIFRHRLKGLRARWRVVAALAVVVALLGSCTSANGTDGNTSITLQDIIDQYRSGADVSVVEEAIVKCMLERGFEYLPAPAPITLRNYAPVDEGLSAREYAAEFGFGISTGYQLTTVRPTNAMLDDWGIIVNRRTNNDVLDELSVTEAQEWRFAIDGVFDGTDVIPGCREIANDDALVVRANDDEFDRALQAYEEQFESDQRVIEVRRQVTQCFAEAGFDYSRIEEAHDAHQAEYVAFLQQVKVENPGAVIDLSDGTGSTLIQLNPQLDERQADVLAALQEAERAAALVADHCGAEGEAQLAEVRLELDAQFIERNSALIESITGTS